MKKTLCVFATSILWLSAPLAQAQTQQSQTQNGTSHLKSIYADDTSDSAPKLSTEELGLTPQSGSKTKEALDAVLAKYKSMSENGFQQAAVNDDAQNNTLNVPRDNALPAGGKLPRIDPATSVTKTISAATATQARNTATTSLQPAHQQVKATHQGQNTQTRSQSQSIGIGSVMKNYNNTVQKASKMHTKSFDPPAAIQNTTQE